MRSISGQGPLLRWLVGGLLVGLPIGVAGLVFPAVFAEAGDVQRAFGSNLLGAIVGGAAEYTTMLLGIRALGLVAAACYLTALLLILRAHKGRAMCG